MSGHATDRGRFGLTVRVHEVICDGSGLWPQSRSSRLLVLPTGPNRLMTSAMAAERSQSGLSV